MIFAQIQPLKDVAVPWLQVYSKGALALPATLVNIPATKRQTPDSAVNFNQSNCLWLKFLSFVTFRPSDLGQRLLLKEAEACDHCDEASPVIREPCAHDPTLAQALPGSIIEDP